MHTRVLTAFFAGLLPCVCCAAVKKNGVADGAAKAVAVMADGMDAGLPNAPEALPLGMVFSSHTDVEVPRRLNIGPPEFAARSSALYSLPLLSAAMRMTGGKLNTQDGSLLNAFAICYRLNGRSSVQVIPGDPAPVKLPVATMANNMGVTIGMVYRLTQH